MRIFIGLTEVSGYYSGLKKGFDQLGVESFFVSLQEHPFKYSDSDKLSALYKFARYCVTKRVNKINQGSSQNGFWTGLVLISRFFLFIWSLFKFDAFLLGGGSTFFRFAEFPILKLFGKKIIYTFHGTDSRPAYIDGFCEKINDIDPKCGDEIVHTYLRVTKRRKNDVAKVEKYADVIVNAPPQAQFHTRPFVIGLVVGLPLADNVQKDVVPNPAKKSKVRILHSPSHIEGKGTIKIRNAIQSLKVKGHPIDYLEISGKPNSEVLEEIKRADFVVDQIYSDSSMAGFCAEAALFGKPAVVGGYYSKHIKDDLQPEWIPPSLYCHPEDIEQAIEKLIVDEEHRYELGKKAQQFVRKNWEAKIVASRYLKLINNEFPRDWLYNPKQNKYIHGMGMPEAKAKIIIKSIIKKYGRQALLLKENPELEQRFVDFAFEEDFKC